jgi:hypothetical protein
MHIIFGNGQATGKYAIGSSEALGTPSDFAESSMKTGATKDTRGGKIEGGEAAKLEAGLGGC